MAREWESLGLYRHYKIIESFCKKNIKIKYFSAGVAQSVEQLIRNQQVAGSNPVTSSTNNKRHPKGCLLFLQTDNGLRITARRFNPLAGDGNPFVLTDISPNRGIPRHQLHKKETLLQQGVFFL